MIWHLRLADTITRIDRIYSTAEMGALRLPAEQLGRNATSLDHVETHGLGDINDVTGGAVRIVANDERHLGLRAGGSRGRFQIARKRHGVTIELLSAGLDGIRTVPDLGPVRNETIVQIVFGRIAVLIDERQNLRGSARTIKSNGESGAKHERLSLSRGELSLSSTLSEQRP